MPSQIRQKISNLISYIVHDLAKLVNPPRWVGIGLEVGANPAMVQTTQSMATRSSPPRTVVRVTLAEQLHEQLKESVIDGTRPPSSRLNIDALAREFGVSSTPIREALARLEQEGLVRLELFAGYSVVPPPEPEYVIGLLQFRMLWEGHCAELGAPKRRPETLAALVAAYEKMNSIRRLGTRYRDYRRFTDADAEFHQAIIDGAENPAMTAIFAGLHVLMLQSRLLLTRSASGAPNSEVMQEHEAILKAYEAGDGLAARQAVAAHFEGGCRRMHSIMQQPSRAR